MWLANGKTLAETATNEIRAMIATETNMIWRNAMIEEITYRDVNPEYHF